MDLDLGYQRQAIIGHVSGKQAPGQQGIGTHSVSANPNKTHNKSG
jgi:hypothetical protein